MIKRLLRFLGWLDRKSGDMWPFPLAGIEPQQKPWLVDRQGAVIIPTKRVVLKAKS